MTTKIESTFGTLIQFPVDSSIGRANTIIAERRDVLTPLVDEFDSIITTINSLKPHEVDGRVTPNLRRMVEDLCTQGLRLPTLKELRESQDLEVRARVDKVMGEVRDGMQRGNETWGWLDKIKSPRLTISSLLLDGYNELMREDPRFQNVGFEKHTNAVGRVIDEASVLYHPEYGINRAASKFYTTEEGFTEGFIDFSQAVRLIEAARILEPDILSRNNMHIVWKFIKENPYDVLDLMRTLNTSISDLNKIATDHVIAEVLKNTHEVQAVLSDHPVPLFLGDNDKSFLMRYLRILRRALKRTNFEMAIGESADKTSDLPEQIQKDWTYSRFHVEVSDPKAIFAALITHMAEFWTKEDPSYRLLGKLTYINALCEVIGTRYPDSELFKLLYDKNGLNWYVIDWGFTQEFIDYLDKKVKEDQK